MLITRPAQVSAEAFEERGARGVLRRTLVSEAQGSKFFRLRFYSLQPGGQTPYDVHVYEHLVIVTSGEGSVLTRLKGVPMVRSIREGDVVYIGPGEPHQFINTGTRPLEFYCFGTSPSLYREEGLAETGLA